MNAFMGKNNSSDLLMFLVLCYGRIIPRLYWSHDSQWRGFPLYERLTKLNKRWRSEKY